MQSILGRLFFQWANLRDGLYTISAIKISKAVTERLNGYAIIMVEKSLCDGNTVYIQTILTTQTPIIVRIAGATEIPNPLR